MTRYGWTCVAALLLAAAVSTGGCSWAMVRQAPPEYSAETADRPPDCTASLGPPISDIWDAVAIGGGLVTTGTISMVVPSLDVDPGYGIAQIAGGVAFGTLFGLSAHHGFSATHRCRQLRDAFQHELYKRSAPENAG